MPASAAINTPLPKLGIIAGRTALPHCVIEACQQQGRDYFVLAFEDNCDETTLAGEVPHIVLPLGSIGKAIGTLRDEGVETLVMAGKISRPKLANLRPDLKATKLLARLGSNLLKGDNEMLEGIIAFLEEEGFTLIGVDDAVPELLTPEGPIGSITPDKKAQADINLGVRIARGIGALDIGQSVIIQHQQIIGVEAIEGTDRLIKRCAELKVDDKGGVLVKVKKPIQTRRADLPTIGVSTVGNIAEAGFSGIALEAGASLLLEREAIAARADELGIFVTGITVNDGS